MTETEKLRHYCRNTHCRTKLEAPVENEHHAFCCRFCFESFYRSRCRVCEKALRNARLTYCRPPNGCKAEARKWPGKYAFPSSGVPQAVFCTASESYADSTGLGFGLRPHHKCLREWIWGSDGENDHSLYDRDGLTVARVALDGGRYHLRSPIAQPRQLWPDLEQAKRGAESIALACSPLDASTASRSKRDNEKPHPMGPPLGYREAA